MNDRRKLPPASVDLGKLADLIHRTVHDQGWACYHPGPGLGCCEGLAREIIRVLKRGELQPDSDDRAG